MRITSFVIAFLFLSCNPPLTPKGPFEQQLVVYSVLSTGTNLQYVRVYSNYDVSGYNPFENILDRPVIGARVVVTGPRGSFIFRDTLLPRADTSRYKAPIAAYVANFRPDADETFALEVIVGSGSSARSSVTIPSHAGPFTWEPGLFLLNDPETYKIYSTISVAGRAGQRTGAYTYQFLITFEVQTGSGWKADSVLVPASPLPLNNSFGYVGGYCNKTYYVSSLKSVLNTFAGNAITFKRFSFRVLQMDQNWCNYYNMVRRAEDTLTTRTDLPDFTNMTSGYGVFGSCTVDLFTHAYPDTFAYNRR